MPGEINCLFTKGLIPFVEKERGPEGVAALCRAAGRPREYLMADHNWLPLSVANELVRVAMELTGETDVERWARRFADDMMDWKPSREYRHYLGTYTMGIGEPARALRAAHRDRVSGIARFCRFEAVVKRRRATFRRTPVAGYVMPPVVLHLGDRPARALPDQLGPAARHRGRATVRRTRRGLVRRRGALEEPAAGPPVLGSDAGRRRRRRRA